MAAELEICGASLLARRARREVPRCSDRAVDQATNLDLADFHVRFLVVDDIWIPLGENMLIETFRPVWDRAIDGFGNNGPGVRRKTQLTSPWDVLHPSRPSARNSTPSPALTPNLLLSRIDDYFAGRPLPTSPRAVREQQASEAAAIEDAADEA
ncbi:Eco29kI family restriction endonuclease [Altererythrobacter sp. KTW20L]|uniref:Eco29kI family restriction endonuclease n=1 Tax=Altererythrobacter sp. KTW20L TaxID=2942210 RepID=UPI0020BEDE9C|nr:Eco29kI family restriction endonuclease [Altererythrobacter sp. KTW20L]MCL6251550.1 Eco29kI family restriction endonuclease [Altererythrobacter sp. KTW20L]